MPNTRRVGGLSFTPVQDIAKPTMKAKASPSSAGKPEPAANPSPAQATNVNAVQIMDNGMMAPPKCRRRHQRAQLTLSIPRQDDEWYDTSSASESGSPSKKNKLADIQDSIVSIVKPRDEMEERLLPYSKWICCNML